VSGVLAQGEAAIQLEIIDRGERAVFIGHATDALLKFLAVFSGPPVTQIAFGIKLASLIVKPMSKLMANDQANSAHVDSIIHLAIKEWRLQNAGREDNLIVAAAVISIHGGRRHAPFQLVHRFADFLNLAVGFKLGGTGNIAHQITAYDAELAVVTQLVRIANLVADGGQL